MNDPAKRRLKRIGSIAGWASAVVLATLQIETHVSGYLDATRGDQKDRDGVQASLDALHKQDGLLETRISEAVGYDLTTRDRQVQTEREMAAMRAVLDTWRAETSARLERIERKVDQIRRGQDP